MEEQRLRNEWGIVTPGGYHIPVLPHQKPNKGDLRVCLENGIPTCYVYNGRKWALKKEKEHEIH